MVRFLVNSCFLLCFFPSLIFFILPTETQPLAVLAAFPILFLKPIRITTITLPALLLVTLIPIYAVVSLYVYPDYVPNIILNAGAYVAPLIVFIALHDKLDLLTPRPLIWSVGAWFATGTVQFFEFVPTGLKSALEAIGQFFIASRFHASPIGGGRGVSLLMAEPSYTAPIILLMALSVIYFHRRGDLGTRTTFLLSCAIAAMIVYTASGTVAITVVLVLLAVWLHMALVTHGITRLVTLFAPPLAAVLGIVSLAQWNSQGTTARGIVVISDFAKLFVNGSTQDVFPVLVAIGGQRIIPLAIGFESLPLNNWMGYGIASWSIEPVMSKVKMATGLSQYSYQAIIGNEIADPAGLIDKPQSFFSVLAFDTGLPGLVLVTWLVSAIVFYRWKFLGIGNTNRLVFIVPAAIWLLALNLMPLSAPWLILAYSIDIVLKPPGTKAKSVALQAIATAGRRPPDSSDAQL